MGIVPRCIFCYEILHAISPVVIHLKKFLIQMHQKHKKKRTNKEEPFYVISPIRLLFFCLSFTNNFLDTFL